MRVRAVYGCVHERVRAVCAVRACVQCVRALHAVRAVRELCTVLVRMPMHTVCAFIPKLTRLQ